MNAFVSKDIGKKLNMSFDDFLNKPKHVIENILRVIDEVDTKKSTATEGLMDDIKKSMKEP